MPTAPSHLQSTHAARLSDSGVRLPGWQLGCLALAALIAVPLLLIFSGWLQGENAVWHHLAETVLPELVYNTLILLAGVTVGVLLLGVGLAWLTSLCEFPGRRFFDWALMLPLAVPAYVLAFVVLGLFDFTGPLQGLLRELFGRGGFWFPEVRSSGGVTVVLVLVLYPYVYMLARSAFLTQGRSTLEAARSLGLTPRAAFFRVALPMARPAIVAGTSLALMETLADFGTVSVFNYDTFTTAIYKAWFGLFNLQAASQLASLLLLFVALALVAERRLRGRARYHETSRGAPPQRFRLQGWRGGVASSAAGLVFSLAFLLPLIQLLIWAWQVVQQDLDPRYFELLAHTLALGGISALITIIAALLLGCARRFHDNRLTASSARIATLGYALPGSVLAVGIMLTFSGLDNLINAIWRIFDNTPPGQIFGGSLLALLSAYLTRFLAVAHGPIESGLERIRPSLSDAAHNLGCRALGVVRRVYLPLLRPGLLTALLLVLVDVMKEMPATLLLRPYGWDTLAVRIYEMTSEGEWERAALPAVTLVLAGLLPVILLVRSSSHPHSTQPH
ncbi:ABC-type Fe3+ transport system, permease component [endosymbiont of Ridgeia piscesae]|jgi:iron(III) transport system permease protein|uniref:ABC-type Fe3+ transport system, permease component n=3 Tax=endosymbiont of Ridgeia piscesae TaxID=54398 RepID=A0A0T5YSN1_9GAMM|nr:iron ABC transporter permease [endosymbiont of Ridgeia piscesae]KRT53631.1 ABC-type Fe3+ transport system, permease component [endosymbiont of Ridgeia piscesae]